MICFILYIYIYIYIYICIYPLDYLRYNSLTIKFNILKYGIQVFLVYWQSCAIISTIELQNIFIIIHWEKNYICIPISTPHSLLFPGPAAAAAKSLQSCLTLCDPTEGSPPGSPIPGILQATTLEWVAISFSNAWKWKVKVKWLSRVQFVATPWTAAHQAPPSMGFSRQEYWSGVPLPSPSPKSWQPLISFPVLWICLFWSFHIEGISQLWPFVIGFFYLACFQGSSIL